jgi:ribosomal peptide maturation radical SAM protein 1
MATRHRKRKPKPTDSAQVSLVSMPFKDLRHPPIQLGLLQRCLERRGISARSHSLELAFMEYLRAGSERIASENPLSISDYQAIATRDFVANLGDWIFKVPPYAPFSSSDDDEYFGCARNVGITDEAIALARRMKAFVPGFLESAAEEILQAGPKMVGFSTVFQQNIASLVLGRILKDRDPSLTIVFGGGNCDGPMGAALHECFPWVDVVVRGEGERAIVDVAEDVIAGRPIRPRDGLCYRVNGRSVAVPQATGPQVPIEEVPTPTYDEFFGRLNGSPLRPDLWPDVAILFESSRGCWWGAKSHCTFCGLNGNLMAFRSKSASRVANEIIELAERYKVLDFVAVDDIIDLRHIKDLLPTLAATGYDLTLFYETKANLTKEQVRTFRRAGVSAIQPGIESLSTPILRLMRKGVSGLQNIRLLKWCAEIGVTPAWNLLYGFPGEPPEEYERMADLIPSLVHLRAPSFMPIQVERFSPYFDRSAEFGLELTGPEPHYRWLYPVPSDALWNIAYDFAHRYVDGRDPASYTGRVAEAVEKWRKNEMPGSLTYRRGPEFLLIDDRRPGLERASYRFDGAEASIYLGCDGGASANELSTLLAAQGDNSFQPSEIEEYLEELVAAKLVYREGDRFLSLAIATNREGVHHSGREERGDQSTVRIADEGAAVLTVQLS